MNKTLSRRELLAAAATVPFFAAMPKAAKAQSALKLTVDREILDVNGKPASVFAIRQANGVLGIVLEPGQSFNVDLRNRSGQPTIIHWHGQTPPAAQDGEAKTGLETLITNGANRGYTFAPRLGTYWMHSHHGLQEQMLMAAPLIVRGPEDLKADSHEVVVLLQDFSFRDPSAILAGLRHGADMAAPGVGHPGAMAGMAMPMGGDQMMVAGNGNARLPKSSAMHGTAKMDLNDVDYDAYLTNHRTLNDPQIVPIERGGFVLLRLINGASSTAFWIDLGALEGRVMAVDGNPVEPLSVRRFPMAEAQRVDVLLRIPPNGGAFPVFAQREGDRARSAVILSTPGAAIRKFATTAETLVGPVDVSFETQLKAAAPLSPRKPDRQHRLALTGGMMPYAWGIDGRSWSNHQALIVAEGERVALDLVNQTGMAHPMHLHGHAFQVMAINGVPRAGALRDTVLVPAKGMVRIAFDANNPGRWLFHCHNLYHMASGMMTEIAYAGFAAGH